MFRQIMKTACKLVRKCLKQTVFSNFKGYFTQTRHDLRTRNNGHLLRLPAVKLNVAKRSFYFMGAELYNDLPLDIRKVKDYNECVKRLNSYFD